jgi:hypothetical protein
MHTTEVHIDIPCKDHLDHISRIGSMKFRMNEDVVKIYSGKPGTMYSGGFGQSDHRQKHVGLRSGRHQGEQAMVFTERLIRVVRQDGYGDFEADEHSRLTVCM